MIGSTFILINIIFFSIEFLHISVVSMIFLTMLVLLILGTLVNAFKIKEKKKESNELFEFISKKPIQFIVLYSFITKKYLEIYLKKFISITNSINCMIVYLLYIAFDFLFLVLYFLLQWYFNNLVKLHLIGIDIIFSFLIFVIEMQLNFPQHFEKLIVLLSIPIQKIYSKIPRELYQECDVKSEVSTK